MQKKVEQLLIFVLLELLSVVLRVLRYFVDERFEARDETGLAAVLVELQEEVGRAAGDDTGILVQVVDGIGRYQRDEVRFTGLEHLHLGCVLGNDLEDHAVEVLVAPAAPVAVEFLQDDLLTLDPLADLGGAGTGRVTFVEPVGALFRRFG